MYLGPDRFGSIEVGNAEDAHPIGPGDQTRQRRAVALRALKCGCEASLGAGEGELEAQTAALGPLQQAIGLAWRLGQGLPVGQQDAVAALQPGLPCRALRLYPQNPVFAGLGNAQGLQAIGGVVGPGELLRQVLVIRRWKVVGVPVLKLEHQSRDELACGFESAGIPLRSAGFLELTLVLAQQQCDVGAIGTDVALGQVVAGLAEEVLGRASPGQADQQEQAPQPREPAEGSSGHSSILHHRPNPASREGTQNPNPVYSFGYRVARFASVRTKSSLGGRAMIKAFTLHSPSGGAMLLSLWERNPPSAYER